MYQSPGLTSQTFETPSVYLECVVHLINEGDIGVFPFSWAFGFFKGTTKPLAI
jgi:hypothetical protein